MSLLKYKQQTKTRKPIFNTRSRFILSIKKRKSKYDKVITSSKTLSLMILKHI